MNPMRKTMQIGKISTIAVIGGLITSTMLTLFVVPVVYTLLDDAGAWLVSRGRPHPKARAELRPATHIAEAAGIGD